MRYFTLLSFLLCCSCAADATNLRGFLVTRDDLQLTGYFNLIEYSATGSLLSFTNDFGDEYDIHPRSVKGFGFSQDGQEYRFISRFHEGQWFFLRLEQGGAALRLYSMPDGSDQWVDDRMLQLFVNPPPRYWFEYGEQQLLGIPRNNFRRVVREFMDTYAPALAAKIGKRGYRYRDLTEIVAACNALRGRQRRRL